MQTQQTKFRFGVALAITFAVAATVAAADSASTNRRSSSSIASGRSGGSSSGFASGGGSGGSRGTSFSEDGKKISITENNSGITLTTTETVDGKEKKSEVRAANAKELEAKYPEAYRHYARRLGGTSASGGAFASGGGSSHASGRSSSSASGGSSGRSSSGGGTSRSVSFNENGKSVTITESSDSGITVTIGEKTAGKGKKTVVKAANPQQLQKKNAEAYRLYQSHMDGAQGAAGAGQGGVAGTRDPKAILPEQHPAQLKQNAGNPPMKEMLEKMLRDLDQ
jgi:hypothetical protein